jgi:hypothetical protein
MESEGGGVDSVRASLAALAFLPRNLMCVPCGLASGPGFSFSRVLTLAGDGISSHLGERRESERCS